MAQQRAATRRRQPWFIVCAVPLLLVMAACNSAAQGTKATATATVAPAQTQAPGTPTAKGPQITPLAGDYSLYVDPTYGYSFEYPTNWLVTPAIGLGQSNVAINDPSAPDLTHPDVILMVRATNDFSVQYVQSFICTRGKNATFAGFPAADLTTPGGDPVNGYTAVAFGDGFIAKGKAFQVWLQGSPKFWNYIQKFYANYKDVWDHFQTTFNPGPDTTPVNNC
jgi:hypothetical protein